MPRRFVIGDVHGHLERLVWLLTSAGLLGPGSTWSGGDAAVWVIGDFVDRGPDGIGVVEMLMALERSASEGGGRVGTLLGNHDVMLVSAHRFRSARVFGGETFAECWLRNGGRASDLEALEDRHIEWLTSRAAMALDADTLLVHADTTSYADYGRTVDDVNAAVGRVLSSDDPGAWAMLMDAISQRHAFDQNPDVAVRFLAMFGGERIVHGHTPIGYATGIPHRRIERPLVYAGGLCVNVDGGIYAGGPGFVHEL